MPDRLDKLRGALADLVSELRAVDSLDAPARRQLEEAASEIIALLHRDEKAPAAKIPEGSLRDRMVEFEAKHPNVAVVVNRLIDILGQMGI